MNSRRPGQIPALIQLPRDPLFQFLVISRPRLEHAARADDSRYIQALRKAGYRVIVSAPQTIVMDKVRFAKIPHCVREAAG